MGENSNSTKTPQTTSPKSNRSALTPHTWSPVSSPPPTQSSKADYTHTPTHTVTASASTTNNYQRDGAMAFLNQGSRPNYISSIAPISFKERQVNLDKTHAHFASNAVTFLSEIREEDFKAPRALWEKVFDAKAKERFISNISGHMANCKEDEIIKRQIGIFREVSEDLASRLEKATGIKGYPGIADFKFNGTHNGMARKEENRVANGMGAKGVQLSRGEANGAPVKGTHASKVVSTGGLKGSINGVH